MISFFNAETLYHRLADDATDFCGEQVDRDCVGSAFGDDHISVALARLNKLLMHDADGIDILVDDRVQCPSPVLDIPHESADEADISRGINENFDIEKFTQLFIFQYEETFQDQYIARIALFGNITAGVMNEIITVISLRV